MKTMIALVTVTGLILAIANTSVAAGCSAGLANMTTNGTHQFGLRSDGVNLGKGQAITLDCAAQMLEVRFRMIFTDAPYNGVAPLKDGDVLKVTIMKMDMTPVAATTTVVAGTPGEPWLTFDFSSHDFRIAPGDYIIGCTTDVPGTAFFRKGPEDVAGTLYTAVDGVWESIPDQDAVFEMTWDPDSIAAASDETSWSLLKSHFE